MDGAAMKEAGREPLFRRFEGPIRGDYPVTFDVYLTAGTEYVVKGELLKGSGLFNLSVLDVFGVPAALHRHQYGLSYSLRAERSGSHQIQAVVESTAPAKRSLTIRIIFYRVYPLPRYILQMGNETDRGFQNRKREE